MKRRDKDVRRILFITFSLFLFSCMAPEEVKYGALRLNLELQAGQEWPENTEVKVLGFLEGKYDRPYFEFPLEESELPGPTYRVAVKKYGSIEVSYYDEEHGGFLLVVGYGARRLEDENDTLSLEKQILDFSHTPQAFTFDRIQKTIFGPYCNGCHNPRKNEGELDLTPEHWNLSSRYSLIDSSRLLIVPGFPDSSYLFWTLEAVNEAPIMPEEPLMPLAHFQIWVIEQWIKNGAEY